MRFTDTHSHINAQEFASETETIVNRANESGVHRIVIPAVSSRDYEAMEEIADSHSKIYLAYGLHPTEIDSATNLTYEIELLKRRIKDGKLVAIGETGLDKYWSTDHIDKQVASLKEHFELSIEHNLPLILHTRDAFDIMIPLIKEYKGLLKGVLHGFSGTIDEANEIMGLGDFYFGIGGVITFKKSTLPEVVKELPLSRIVLETDAPYLAPTPFRGKRNEPSYIPIIAQKTAEVKEIDISEVSKMSEEACNKLFNF